MCVCVWVGRREKSRGARVKERIRGKRRGAEEEGRSIDVHVRTSGLDDSESVHPDARACGSGCGGGWENVPRTPGIALPDITVEAGRASL